MSLRFVVAVTPLFSTSLPAEDCNRNGTRDAVDIATGASFDCNLNGAPDECDLAPQLRLAAPESFALGAGPLQLLAGDLDGDALPDIASVNDWAYSAREVSVVRNAGRRAFLPAQTFPAGHRLQRSGRAELADLDGDLDLDLAVNFETGTGLLFNDGAGAFSRATIELTGTLHNGVAAADLDGDGRSDLVVGVGDPALRVLMSQGGSTFQVTASRRIGEDLSGLTMSDVNGDGRTDLLALFAGSSFSVYLNSPEEGLLPPVTQAIIGWRCRGLAMGDLDGDLDPDLAVASASGPGLEVFRNDGEGTYASVAAFPTEGDSGPVSGVAAIDWEEDGDLDLFLTAERQLESGRVFLNQGDAGFVATDLVVAGLGSPPLSPGDLDADGHQDLAVASLDHAAVIWNDGAGAWSLPGRVTVAEEIDPRLYLGRAAVADLDGDANQDVTVLAGQDWSLVTFPGDGQGHFGPSRRHALAAQPRSHACGDLDGDGDMDLAITYATREEGARLWFNDGSGTLSRETPLPFPAADPATPAIVDLDRDGRLDLLVTSAPPGGIGVYLSLGGGDFAASPVLPLPSLSRQAASGDIDGDAETDLVAAPSDTDALVMFPGAGSGTFGARRLLPAGSGLQAAALHDLDRDGDLDLIVIGESGRAITVRWNDGDGAFAGSLAPVRIGEELDHTTLADLDGDGNAELIGRTGYWAFWVFPGKGSGGFDAGRRFPLGSPGNVAAADLDADGDSDIVTGNGASLALVWNQSRPASSRDADGDGAPDDCRERFHRGDSAENGVLEISDAISIFGFLFLGDAAPRCREAADVNNDGSIDLSDGIALLGYLFLGTQAPAAPGPPGGPCGIDADATDGPKDLGCEAYGSCG